MEKIEQVYMNTPKKDVRRIEAAEKAAVADILNRHLPKVTLNMWSPPHGQRFNFLPSICRLYVSSPTTDYGYIGVKRTGKSPDGYYESHRMCKGEDIYTTEEINTLPCEIKSKLTAAVRELWERIGEVDRLDDSDQFDIIFGKLSQ